MNQTNSDGSESGKSEPANQMSGVPSKRLSRSQRIHGDLSRIPNRLAGWPPQKPEDQGKGNKGNKGKKKKQP